MTKEKNTTDDTNHSNIDIDGLITLFSSDNTELTDFTERVQKAFLGDKQKPQNSNENDDQPQDKSDDKPESISPAKNNVVNLFGPK
jgi:hypothetical protein